ncbi:hypothetical protein DDV98_29620 [Streptomyces sp. IB2014 011-12]|nr:hypothetical protein DDV98_29620 [Streptomyces sp. IB2014 011-12]
MRSSNLEQLHLAARGGVGLEDFYGRLGWKEIGRWPGALRLARLAESRGRQLPADGWAVAAVGASPSVVRHGHAHQG